MLDAYAGGHDFHASLSRVSASRAAMAFANGGADLESRNFTADSICSVLSSATKAIVAIYLAELPLVARSRIGLYELPVIEDCANPDEQQTSLFGEDGEAMLFFEDGLSSDRRE